MSVGKIIISQIRSIDKDSLLAWGTQGRFYLIENGVEFDIRTPLYMKGAKVKITLNWMDTYDIEVIKNNVVIEKTNNVYVEELVESIDNLIEKDKKNIWLMF
uniref:hypothetical protein n=1 Tax=Aeromonas sp. Ne-1 TaxID=1675689 RepID=UPI00156344AD|nr:hypothetical protein [Aeromonas sp. Ne-1]